MSRFDRGFTLIELLVVIAIIAILAAILFPVFARAREKARQTTCLSNLKQLALAVEMYAQDYDECVPGYRHHEGDRSMIWTRLLEPYIRTGDTVRPEEHSIFRCPSGNRENRYHYGWNYRYLGWPGGGTHSSRAALSLAEVTYPAETISIAESRFGVRIVYAPSITSGGVPLWENANPGDDHNGGANYAFLDGHAKWMNQNTAMRSGGDKYWRAVW